MEQRDINLLYRWFVGFGVDDPAWDATVFRKNRDRLLAGDVAQRILDAVLNHARVRGQLCDEHFSVDGTLIEAWASMKRFRPKGESDDEAPPAGRNGERDFHGETQSNETQASTTDPDARPIRKGRGKKTKLCYAAHVVKENRNGLAVAARTTCASSSTPWRFFSPGSWRPSSGPSQNPILGRDFPASKIQSLSRFSGPTIYRLQKY